MSNQIVFYVSPALLLVLFVVILRITKMVFKVLSGLIFTGSLLVYLRNYHAPEQWVYLVLFIVVPGVLYIIFNLVPLFRKGFRWTKRHWREIAIAILLLNSFGNQVYSFASNIDLRWNANKIENKIEGIHKTLIQFVADLNDNVDSAKHRVTTQPIPQINLNNANCVLVPKQDVNIRSAPEGNTVGTAKQGESLRIIVEITVNEVDWLKIANGRWISSLANINIICN